MTLSHQQDRLYYVDKYNQLLQVDIQLEDDGRHDVSRLSRYVHSNFHQQEITGMDICLRKQLIVTCSKRIIHIWNYKLNKLVLTKIN